MTNIAEGSVVQLKSGSPYMTVTRIYTSSGGSGNVQMAECQWFNINTPMEKAFPLKSLDLVDLDEGPVEPQIY